VETTSGYILAGIMKKQARAFGCSMKSNIRIKDYDLEGDEKRMVLEDGRIFKSRSVILAPGGKPRPLNIPGENRFKGTGISYCATCDGDFFTGKEIAVVGGGNSALEEAVTLTRYASKVTIVHQFDHFQAFQHAIDEATRNPKIRFIMESELRQFTGNGSLKEVSVEHLPTGKRSALKVDGVFIFVGYMPNTSMLQGIVELNDRQEIVVDEKLQTSIPGVFAAGDCIPKRYRQVTTAVADGTIASLSAAEFLRS
jgi:thioredoxin reductase (NADPH)